MEGEWYSPTSAGDVTDEIVEFAFEVCDGWYQDRRIDWADVWDRMDGGRLADGRRLNLGTDLLSPALAEIKRRVRALRD